MKSGSTLSDVATRVDNLRRSTRDFLAKPGHLAMTVADGQPSFSLDDGGGTLDFGIQDHVHDQLATLADIPLAYYRRMKVEAPELLADNANTWLRRGDTRRMVRTIRNADEQPVVRAVLSDRYRPLDSYNLLEAVLPLLQSRGIRIESCELTEKKLYVKAVSERTTAEVKVGETVQAGLVVTNSEVGFGALSIQPLVWTLRCTNGMIVEDSSMRRNHVGRRHDDSGDDLQHLLTDETRAADDKAFFLRVRDVATAALDEAVFHRHVQRLRVAAGNPITSNALDKVVEVTAKRFGLTQDEGDGVLAHLIRGGDLSQWGLCSAITCYSQDVASYDRATDLERIGGRLVELPRTEWQSIASMN